MGHDTEMRRLRGFGDTNFVMLGTGEGSEVPAVVPLPEVLYAFDAQGQTERRWQVRHFELTEGLSTLYECAVDLAADTLAENPDTLLGRYALLQWQREPVLRKLFGVVRRVEHRGATGSHRLARVFMAPALWTLSQRSDARVFQGLTAVEVVQAVLQEAGLYAGMLDLQLQRQYPAREYCVQYRETDLAFVQRLLESEGVTFFFRHEEEGETLVLADGAHAWGAVRTMDGGPIPIAGAELATERVEAVRHLRWERELRPTGAVVRDFDFTRPDFRLERMAPRRRDGARTLYEPAPSATIGQYAGAAYTRDDAQEQAQLRHEAAQVPGAVGEGEGVVVGMAPGGMFALTLAGTHVPAQRYLVTRVEHTGDAPDALLHGALPGAAEGDRYRNRFACVPVEVAFRPARATPRPTIAGMQTATVTGPAGEEVYTDEHGRVRVRFHWDRVGGGDAHATCWLRTVQGPWAGNGWGFQFLPRVGMEVAVSFVEGDPDRPVVTGALYNGHHGAPFPLPGERTRSGVRTQTVGGGGYNELSFEDGAGAEQVLLRAQRDLTVDVLRDRAVRVAGQDDLHVGGDRRERVDGNRAELVAGRCARRVTGDASHDVGGDQSVAVEGVTTVSARAGVRATVGAEFQLFVEGEAAVVVGGGGERAGGDLYAHGDLAVASGERLRLRADTSILLQCGESTLEISPHKVTIQSREVSVTGTESTAVRGNGPVLHLDDHAELSAARVTLRGSGASVRLDDDATVRGAAVKLASSAATTRADEGAPRPDLRTLRLKLSDLRFHAYAGKRYELVVGGVAHAGTTGSDGTLSEQLPRDATAATLTLWTGTYPTGPRERWSIRLAEALPEPGTAGGARLRLHNLGYLHLRSSADALDEASRQAVCLFQRDHDLEPTGELDGPTCARLSEVHGH